MLSETFILNKLHKLPLKKQVECLLKALKVQKDNPQRSNTACIAIALNIPNFPKVSKILAKDGYQLTLLFAHGEARAIDFQKFFKPERKYEKVLLDNRKDFDKVEVKNDTLVWPEVGYWSKNFEGEDLFMCFDIDPAVLYEVGTPATVNVG